MKGVHILSSFFDCGCGPETLQDFETVKEQIRESIIKSGLTVFDDLAKNFRSEDDQYGYSIVFGLLESHVSLHTFPEENGLLVDVFACHYKRDNTDKAMQVYDDLRKIFNPTRIESESIVQR